MSYESKTDIEGVDMDQVLKETREKLDKKNLVAGDVFEKDGLNIVVINATEKTFTYIIVDDDDNVREQPTCCKLHKRTIGKLFDRMDNGNYLWDYCGFQPGFKEIWETIKSEQKVKNYAEA
jgi:hypothetical protein